MRVGHVAGLDLASLAIEAPREMGPTLELHFDHGTLVLSNTSGRAALDQLFVFDHRTHRPRAPAHRYAQILRVASSLSVTLVDRAAEFERTELHLEGTPTPRAHQRAAFAAWQQADGRGVVELPTGAGKTLVGLHAIKHAGVSTLVVVPTLDLLEQWHAILEAALRIPIGRIGGGISERKFVTVTTYDSAVLFTDTAGHRAGLIIFDECHHLPAPAYRFIAEGSLAPLRLGLSATAFRPDGLHEDMDELVGPLVHRTSIQEIEGQVLAPYRVERCVVRLDAKERAAYDQARATYLGFARKLGFSIGGPRGWQRFVQMSQRSAEGRAAFSAYRAQRKIALSSEAKLAELWRIVMRHRHERVLVFTEDNETVFRLSRQFLWPSITHHTKPAERRVLLAALAEGRLPVLLTSKVLNEGVDVPEVNVGVVMSGSGSVRQHVQRLGRILRHRPGKEAILYELISDTEAEASMGERRSRHEALSGRKADPSC